MIMTFALSVFFFILSPLKERQKERKNTGFSPIRPCQQAVSLLDRTAHHHRVASHRRRWSLL